MQFGNNGGICVPYTSGYLCTFCHLGINELLHGLDHYPKIGNIPLIFGPSLMMEVGQADTF